VANKPFRAIADRPELVAALAGKADGARFLGFTRQIVAVDEADRFAKAGAAQDGDLWFQPVAGAPADTTAPAAPTAFSSTAGNAQNVLAWTNPTLDFAGVKVLRKAGGYPATITDGTVVYTGVGTGYTDVGRTNGVADFYAIFAFDAVPNYSAPATATSTPTLGNVAPAAFTPVVSAITATGCTVTASTTDANGDPLTYKYQVLPTAAAAPAAADASWTSAAVLTSPQAWIGGAASTAYKVHVRASDGTLFTVGSSLEFTTIVAPLLFNFNETAGTAPDSTYFAVAAGGTGIVSTDGAGNLHIRNATDAETAYFAYKTSLMTGPQTIKYRVKVGNILGSANPTIGELFAFSPGGSFYAGTGYVSRMRLAVPADELLTCAYKNTSSSWTTVGASKSIAGALWVVVQWELTATTVRVTVKDDTETVTHIDSGVIPKSSLIATALGTFWQAGIETTLNTGAMYFDSFQFTG